MSAGKFSTHRTISLAVGSLLIPSWGLPQGKAEMGDLHGLPSVFVSLTQGL